MTVPGVCELSASMYNVLLGFEKKKRFDGAYEKLLGGQKLGGGSRSRRLLSARAHWHQGGIGGF
jgi:hypothetical protein